MVITDWNETGWTTDHINPDTAILFVPGLGEIPLLATSTLDRRRARYIADPFTEPFYTLGYHIGGAVARALNRLR